jgi:hypothetical protein
LLLIQREHPLLEETYLFATKNPNIWLVQKVDLPKLDAPNSALTKGENSLFRFKIKSKEI